MFYVLLTTYCILFAALAWRKLSWAVLFVIATLPSYLVRFRLGPVPTTLLEGMLLIVIALWAIQKLLAWHTESGIRNQESGVRLLTKSLIHNSLFLIPLTLFLFAATVSALVAPDLRAAAGIWKAYFVEPILFFLVLRDLLSHNVILNGAKRSEESLTAHMRVRSFASLRMTPGSIVTALSLTALLLSAYAIYQRFTGFGIPPPWDAELRVTSVFPYPNALALFLAPLVPLFVAQVIAAWRRASPPSLHPLPRWEGNGEGERGGLRWVGYWLLVTTLNILAIIFAKSTGALVGVAAGLIFMGLFTLRGKAHDRELFHARRLCFLIAVTVLAALAVFTVLAKPSLKDELLLRNWPGHVRRTQWAETVAMLKDTSTSLGAGRPIFGAGLAGYKETLAPYHKATYIEIFEYPHNIVLNFWSETGLLGVVAFVWLVVIFFRRTIGKLHVTRYTLHVTGAVAAMVVILVHGLVDVPYFKNDLAILFWIIYALGLTNAQKSENIQS